MHARSTCCAHTYRRRGAVVPFVAVMIPVLLGFAALSIDIGYLHVVRAQLQNAADAAALAGTSAYFEDIGLSQNRYELINVATQRAQQMSLKNRTANEGTILDAADVALGRHDFDHRTGPLLSDGRWNAVQVTVRRTPGSSNGPVILFFAPIFKIFESGVAASARAASDDRFSGYRADQLDSLMPFAIREDIYNWLVHNGPDDFSYDTEVRSWGDGIREVRLYPWTADDLYGSDGPDGAGNFGTLNVGALSQGTSILESQIRNGIGLEVLEAEFGTSELAFYDQYGAPRTYVSSGNPGLSAGMKDAIEARIGDVVGFFLHRGVTGTGSNAVYEISGLRFGRIVDVRLGSNPDQRALSIQPVAYTSGSISVLGAAPSTDGQVGRMVLVQ